MITCPACTSDNEDFFMFCLTCGAELTGEAASSDVGLETTEYTAADLGVDEKLLKADPADVPPPAAVPTARPERPDAAATTQVAPAAAVIQAQATSAAAATQAAPAAAATQAAPAAAATQAAPAAAATQAAPAAAATQAAPAAAATQAAPAAAATQAAPAAAAPAAAAPPAQERSTRGRLVLIQEDGTDGPTYDLYTGKTVVGRDGGDLKFPQDEFLGTEHALFEYNGNALSLTPLETTNGVFKRIVDQAELVTGDSFRIGQELLRFELVQDIDGEPIRDEEGTLALGSPLPPDSWGRLSQMVGTEDAGNVYLLSGQEIFMGRERGDIVFPEDGYVSGSHAVIARANNRYYLRDLGSSNGTYVRLKSSEDLLQNDLVLAGQQLFRVEP